MKRILLFLVFSLCLPQILVAETIEFDEEELARESVLPVFDNPAIVRSRLVETKGRVEFVLNAGLSLNEAFYNTLNYGGVIGYHIDETNGVELLFNSMAGGLSTYGEQLKRGEGLEAPNTFDASLAPSPKSMFSLNYHYTAYYGKISLSKQTIMNLSLYFGGGAGMITIGQKQNPVVTLTMGQRLYYSSNVALRIDLSVFTYQGPDPTSISLATGSSPQPYSAFSEKLYINPSFNIGLVLLL